MSRECSFSTIVRVLDGLGGLPGGAVGDSTLEVVAWMVKRDGESFRVRLEELGVPSDDAARAAAQLLRAMGDVFEKEAMQ